MHMLSVNTHVYITPTYKIARSKIMRIIMTVVNKILANVIIVKIIKLQ